MRTWSVYALIDPRTNAVRYVGWAFNPKKRLGDHCAKAAKETNHKAAWLRLLRSLALAPVLTILETGAGDWAAAERKWIAHHRAAGADLTNATDGGEGVVGLVFSPASRAKMSAAKQGRRLAPEHVRKVAESNRGRPCPPHVRAALTAANTGRPMPEHVKRALVAANIGKAHTPETRTKMSASRTGKHHSEESKARCRAAKVGRPLSAEHRAKLSAAKKGRPMSEEQKAKRRGKRWHHTPEAIAKITAARRARTAT